MDSGLSITIEDVDPDYLGLTVRAWNPRYSGSTYVYVAPGQLSAFGDCIAGFPNSASDERVFEFGRRRGEHFAGGFCGMSFRYPPGDVLVCIEEDVQRFSESMLDLTVHTEAAYIDRFVASLRSIEAARCGSAQLNSSD